MTDCSDDAENLLFAEWNLFCLRVLKTLILTLFGVFVLFFFHALYIFFALKPSLPRRLKKKHVKIGQTSKKLLKTAIFLCWYLRSKFFSVRFTDFLL